jgi:hypothetical protein
MQEIKGINGHIVLYCKGHYECKEDRIEGLKMIWAIRCGYDYKKNDDSSLRYIANNLYEVISPFITDYKHFQRDLHDYLTTWMYDDLSAIHRIIHHYCSFISVIQIYERVGDKLTTLVQLPEPNPKLFNRILRGEGKYTDYKLIND